MNKRSYFSKILKVLFLTITSWRGIAEPLQGLGRRMTGQWHVGVQRMLCAGLVAAGVLSAISSPAFAQQGVALPVSGSQPISTAVAVEYATIGSVQIPIPLLNSTGASANGQTAYNQQVGTGNTTAINQTGQRNRAGVEAIGNNNVGLITQQGRNNVGQATLIGNALRIDLQQLGNGNQADLSLTGPGGGNLLVRQAGDGSTATVSAPAGRDVTVSQVGNGLSVDVSQVGAQKNVSVQQVRVR